MAVWVFGATCSSAATNGDFTDAFWWDVANQQKHDVVTGDFVPELSPGDQVYFAVLVDGGNANGVSTSDLRAAVGRKKQHATISSPFQSGTFTLQNAGGAPSTLASQVSPDSNTWAGVGPYTVVRDPGKPGKQSRYEFVLTATLTNGAQFGQDPEMDVNNGN